MMSDDKEGLRRGADQHSLTSRQTSSELTLDTTGIPWPSTAMTSPAEEQMKVKQDITGTWQVRVQALAAPDERRLYMASAIG